MLPNKLRSKVKKLESDLAAMKPASAPGVLTNRTSRGVTRRATPRAATPADTIPRYL